MNRGEKRLSGRTAILVVLAYAVITLIFPSIALASYSISTDKSTYFPYDDIRVTWTAPEDHKVDNVIVILPSSAGNISPSYGNEDWEDNAYLTDVTGIENFTAPFVPGSYDFRIYTKMEGGGILAQTTITVQAGGGSITLDKSDYRPGESLRVNYSYTPNFPVDAFLAMAPAGLAHGNAQLACDNDLIQLDNQDRLQRLSGNKTEERVFAAPATPGSYEMRMYDNLDARGNEVCSFAFTVSNQGLSPSLKPTPPIQQAGPKVVLDDKQLSFDVPPMIDKGRVLVPMRAIFEALGANIAWNGKTQTVTGTKGNTKIELVIGGAAYKNGQKIALDVPARIVDSRTMVPLRFVSEALGAKVEWDGTTKTVTILSQ